MAESCVEILNQAERSINKDNRLPQQLYEDVLKSFGTLRQIAVEKSQQDMIRENLESRNIDIFKIFFKVSKAQESLEQQNSAQLESFFLQFVTNFVTGNQKNKEFIYSLIEVQNEEEFKKIYTTFEKDHKYLKFITLFLHNFIKENENSELVRKLMQNQNSKFLFQLVFREYLGNGDTDYAEKSQTSQYYDWILQLVNQCFQTKFENQPNAIIEKEEEKKEGFFEYFSAYAYLVDDLFKSEKQRSEQMYDFIVHLIQKFLDDKVQPTHLRDFVPDSMDIRCSYMNYINYMFKFSTSDFDYILKQFQDETQQFMELIDTNMDAISQKSEQIGEETKKQINIHLKSVFENIRILCLLTFLGGYNNKIQKHIMKRQTLSYLMKLLRVFKQLNTTGQDTVEAIMEKNEKQINAAKEYNKLQNISEKEEDEEEEETKGQGHQGEIEQFNEENCEQQKKREQEEEKQKMEKLNQIRATLNKEKLRLFQKVFDACNSQELFSCTIRLISNIVHINREAQDFICQNEYLGDCLSFSSGIELNDPLSREWSIVLIRNLCDSHDEIQDKISKMKVMHFDNKVKDIVGKYQQKKQDLETLKEVLSENKDFM